mmetsp:Transcript_27552/g.27234  ORF Transcript_27552/g.27234 Transcript_27552/m.27234 type:complete len:81 (+) Transcript_27552:55-297(+)
MRVGISASTPKTNNINIEFKFNPTSCIELIIVPALMCIQFPGISPKKVAVIKYFNDIPKIGLDILINQFGTIGVTLKNSK